MSLVGVLGVRVASLRSATETVTVGVRDYIQHPEFRAFLACWIRDRRCPCCFGDWLQEQGLDSAAEAARWAATQPDRPQFMEGFDCGPFPAMFGDGCYWFYGNDRHANCLRIEAKVVDCKVFDDFENALVALLDNWNSHDCPRLPDRPDAAGSTAGLGD